MQKVYRDDYAIKYSNKVYIGSICKQGRGDGTKPKIKNT